MAVLLVLTAGVSAAALEDFTYTYVGSDPGNQPSSEYPDAGGIELNDNLIGALQQPNGDPGNVINSATRSRWAGFIDTTAGGGFRPQPQMDIVFTDPAGHSLDSVTVIYHVDDANYIRSPDSLTLTFSEDGIDYLSAPPQVFTTFPSDNLTVHTVTFPLAVPSARYVRAVFLNDGGDTYWTFLTEIDLTGGPAIVPEPASLGLLALGGAALLIRRRG